MSDIKLICGTCIYWEEQINPNTQKPGGRGFCYGNPPTVILMPGERARVALGQEGEPINFVPQMLRPVLNKNERFCGMYIADHDTQLEISKQEKEQDGEDVGESS
jgi:hypothetical protein